MPEVTKLTERMGREIVTHLLPFTDDALPGLIEGTKRQSRIVLKEESHRHPKYPFFKPGQIIGVQESFFVNPDQGETSIAYLATPNRYRTLWTPHGRLEEAYIGSKPSTEGEALAGFVNDPTGQWLLKKPSEMPGWACRFLLKVEDYRVESLQQITMVDLERMGYLRGPGSIDVQEAGERFERYWNNTFKPMGYGFDVDPWVGVIDFSYHLVCRV